MRSCQSSAIDESKMNTRFVVGHGCVHTLNRYFAGPVFKPVFYAIGLLRANYEAVTMFVDSTELPVARLGRGWHDP
jgi:hypothetical protein